MAGIVSGQSSTSGALPHEMAGALLRRAERARREGNPAAARALLHALSAQRPDLPQVWFALAIVAETRAEQRRALERVITLDPRHTLARRGLARMGGAESRQFLSPAAPGDQVHGPRAGHTVSSAVQDAPAASGVAAAIPAPIETVTETGPAIKVAPSLTSIEPAVEEAGREIRWPLYAVIGLSILVVLIAAILIRGSDFRVALWSAPTPALPGVAIQTPASGVAAIPAATSTEAPAAKASSTPQPTAGRPTPTPSPRPTPRQTLTPGQIVKQGQWHAILLRPEDAVILDGSIGQFQPRGRFVLALVAVGNDGRSPTRLPKDLFALVDNAGNRYAPLPSVSTAYLDSYGRGQHGDLSMEDPIPSDGGNKSVPLIFDVPPSARPLYLVVGDSTAGWPVG